MKTMADEMHEQAMEAASTKEKRRAAQEERKFQDLLSRIRGLAAVGLFNLKTHVKWANGDRFNSTTFDCIESNRLKLESEGFTVERKEKRYGFLGIKKEVWYNISW